MPIESDSRNSSLRGRSDPALNGGQWTQIADESHHLDARFRIEANSLGLDFVYQSRGGRIGSPESRNTEYSQGLTKALQVFAGLGGTIIDALVDSSRVRDLREDERRIVIAGGYPVHLVDGQDLGPLKSALMRGQVAVGQSPAAVGSRGNSSKRIRIRLTFRCSMTAERLTGELCGGTGDLPSAGIDFARRDEPEDTTELDELDVPGLPEGHFQVQPLGRDAAISALHELSDRVTFAIEASDGNGSSGPGQAPCDLPALLEAMAGVGDAVSRLEEALGDLAADAGLATARGRILSYLLERIGEPVTNSELTGVSGIQASGRRIRELREDGLEITSGPGDGLAPGEYRLEPVGRGAELASRWALLNSMRAGTGLPSERALMLLKEDYPFTTPLADLRLVVAPAPLQSALDELEFAGWSIEEVQEPGASPGARRLANLRRTASRINRSTTVREAVLIRDGRRCLLCGTGSIAGSELGLQIHRKRTRPESDTSGIEVFESLCTSCHGGIHRDDSVDGTSDELLFPHRDPWQVG